MARRMRPETAVAVKGARALQAAAFRARLERLPVSTDVYDFSHERDDLEHRIAQLDAGRAVYIQAWELAAELVASAGLRSRWDRSGPRCFRIEGDELIPEDYERVSSVPDDTIEPTE